MLEWLTGETAKAWIGWWPAGGFALLAALLAARRLRGAGRRHSLPGGRASAPERETETHADDASTLLRDLDRLTADFESRLNDVLARLDAATRAADERISRIESLLASEAPVAALARGTAPVSAARPTPVVDESLGAAQSAAAGERAAPQGIAITEPPPPSKRREAHAARIPVQPRDGAADLPRSASELNSAAPPRPPVSELHARVYALADAGRSAMQISEAVGRPLGEIELLLQLRALR
ncbi:MAG: hypothetical protein HRF50_03775 [Phycisphaerae bacterium]|jgi:hypothetical protein